MISTTGVLLFDSGYTTNVSTERPSCLIVTHSRWRGDFSKVALAQSCAEAKGATHKISREIKVMRFMVWFLLQTAWLAGNEPKSSRSTRGIVMQPRKACHTS